MPKIKFYDLKTKKSFITDEYRTEKKKQKNGRVIHFAVAENPSGNESWKIVSKSFYERLK